MICFLIVKLQNIKWFATTTNLHYLFSKICSLVDLVSGSNHLLELDSELLWILNLSFNVLMVKIVGLSSSLLVMIMGTLFSNFLVSSNILVEILNTLFSNILMKTHSFLLLVLNTLGPLTTMVLMLMVAFLLMAFFGLLTTFSTWLSVALKLLQLL